ncbi:MAG TPA: dicarboxylate/amino acid:cation symporter, partial [Gemmatimonadaceae bacterium]
PSWGAAEIGYLRRVSLSTRVLIALALGVLAGLGLSVASPHLAGVAVSIVEPIGTLFVNAIRMTVVPLVVSSLIVGIATSSSGGMVARIGARGFVVFVVLLLASGIVGAIVAPPVLARMTLDPAAVASIRASSASTASGIASGASAMQSPSEWLVALIPSNVMKAAVDGSMLPLIVFSLVLGLALLRLPTDLRANIVAVFKGVSEAMLVVVEWVLVVAPIGVFALALPLVARLGLAAVGALATYVILVSLAAAVFILCVLYPAAAWGGGISLRAFARAALPPQAVAFSSRSSLAALPALIETGRTRLGFPDEITSFFMPLATVVFRVGAALGLTTGAVFIARLYGVAIGPSQLVTIVITAILTSFSIPGIPGGSIIAMVPVLVAVGLPIEGLGILLGVDTIPDMFRTTANVTGQLAAAAIVARRSAATPAADSAIATQSATESASPAK